MQQWIIIPSFLGTAITMTIAALLTSLFPPTNANGHATFGFEFVQSAQLDVKRGR
jgi:hypothetical protein